MKINEPSLCCRLMAETNVYSKILYLSYFAEFTTALYFIYSTKIYLLLIGVSLYELVQGLCVDVWL